MGVVKTARAIVVAFAASVDEEDRELFSTVLAWTTGLVYVAIVLAITLGLAVRVFGIAAG